MTKYYCKFIFIFILFYGLYHLPAIAAPSIGAVSLVQGSTMVRTLNSTVTLTWNIINPDPQVAQVTLQLEPEGSHGGAIYTQEITLGPKSSLSGRSLVVIANSERYLASLIQDNARIDKTDIILREGQLHRLQIALITDYDEIAGYSNIAKEEKLSRRINFCNFRQAGVPEHYSGFRDFSLLILLRPKLSNYKFSQMQAILDFVNRGGCVVIGDAETALSLQNTPLAALLPYQPVAKKYFDGLAKAREAFQLPPKASPQRDENGDLLAACQQEFLEILTPLRSRVLLEMAGRPAICLRRTGLGSSLGLCFDPFFLSQQDSDFMIPLWDIIIRYSNYRLDNHSPDAIRAVNTTLQHLQGFSIPPISLVMKIFWLYMLSGAFILIVFFHFRRPALAWGVLCISSVLFTAFIFIKARNVATNQAERSFTAITAGLWDGSSGVRWGTGNFFSKADCRPTVSADVLRTFFLPQAKSVSHEGGTALAPSPLRLTYTKQHLKLERMSLQQYRPRTLCWENIAGNYGRDKCALPKLEFTKQGFVLQPWALPEGKQQIQRAVLALPGDVLSLRIADGIARLSNDNGVETDVVYLSAINYIKALRLPHPTICLITPLSSPSWPEFAILNDDNEFGGYDYHLDLLPVSCSELPEDFLLPPAFCSVDIPSRSFLRQNYKYGEFTEVFLQDTSKLSLPFDLEVYPAGDFSQVKQISIELDISNPSGKALFALELQDLSGNILLPAKSTGNTFFFNTTDRTIVSPELNKFRVNLLVSTQSSGSSTAAVSQRVNYWKILALKATLNN